MAVRGFLASKFLSNQRLKAMAALRAVTMQRMTKTNIIQSRGLCKWLLLAHPIVLFRFHCPKNHGEVKTARKNPINANGIAKMV